MKISKLNRGVMYLGLGALLCVPALRANAATAMPQAPEHQGMRDGFQEAVNSLNLTDDQKTKLTPIFADAKAKRGEIYKDTSLTPDQKKEKMMALREDTKTKVNAVLTPDQQAELKTKMEAAMKAKAAAQ
jgi:Spy/CpxP family protein refolding chaperone